METATKDRVFFVPRPYFGSVTAVRELHIFCDASKRAFGAVTYLLHKEKTAFVLAKSRVTPIGNPTQADERDLTNPETELMAALMGSLLAESIAAALEVMGIRLRIFLWSDSQIVLYWIFKSDGYPRQFIANRVKKIQEISTRRLATWKFVKTTDNPADILSRGCTSKDLKTSTLWKSGPEWLPKKELWPDWSAAQFKQSVVLHVSQTNEEVPRIYSIIDPSRYRWTKLLRYTAVTQRFINNLKLRDMTRQSWKTQPISASELQSAELIWIQATQKKFCKHELEYLQEKRKRRQPPLVSHLKLYLENGILKCGGRLNNAEFSQAAKHPIFIPKNSDITALIITSMHERMFHANVDLTITTVRQRYWIPSLRQRVKSIVHRCVHCLRIKDSGAAYPS